MRLYFDVLLTCNDLYVIYATSGQHFRPRWAVKGVPSVFSSAYYGRTDTTSYRDATAHLKMASSQDDFSCLARKHYGLEQTRIET